MTELYEWPASLSDWGSYVELNTPSEAGGYVLIDAQPSPIEQQHIVKVVDEAGQLLDNVMVIFGYDSGASISRPSGRPYWKMPAVIKGNAQRTLNGLAYHTVGEGGETIFPLDPLYPPTMVHNATWRPMAHKGWNNHTCLLLTWQLRRAGVPVMSLSEQLKQLRERLAELEYGLHGD